MLFEEIFNEEITGRLHFIAFYKLTPARTDAMIWKDLVNAEHRSNYFQSNQN